MEEVEFLGNLYTKEKKSYTFSLSYIDRKRRETELDELMKRYPIDPTTFLELLHVPKCKEMEK